MSHLFFKLTFVLILFTAFSCGTDDEAVVPADDYSALLSNIANNVILETYKDLDDKTGVLVNTLSTLENSQIAVNLESARQAWRDTRVPWEQSEGFLFGPVDQNGIDPAMDSWPVNQTDLDAVLNSSSELTKDYIDGLDGTLKGFHTIEYLLFGVEGNKSINDFTVRQFEYLTSCAQSLKGSTQALYFSWKPDQQNYIANIIEAGNPGNSIYPSQKSALEEFVNGMVGIADEVANGKINDPFSQQNVNLEESRFSANSKRDFADNIRSIQNIYQGTYKANSGEGIADVIAKTNSTLNDKTIQQIESAIAAIESIEGTFTTAIFNARPSVENAQIKVRSLQQTLESEILPLISNL